MVQRSEMVTVLRMSKKYPRRSSAGITTIREGTSSLLVPMSAVKPYQHTECRATTEKNAPRCPNRERPWLLARLRLRVDTTLLSLNSGRDQSAIRAPMTQRNRGRKVLELKRRVPRDAIPPIPPGPEGSNGNGLVRVQRGARLGFSMKKLLWSLAAIFLVAVLGKTFLPDGLFPDFTWVDFVPITCPVLVRVQT